VAAGAHHVRPPHGDLGDVRLLVYEADPVELRVAGVSGRRTIGRMAYDEDLADRIRELLSEQRGVTEKTMFGGLAFLIRGNMAIAASGMGGALIRVDPGQAARLVETTPAEAAVMRDRPMRGWLRVESDDVRTKRRLEKWVKLGSAYASSLPPKKK
jgi:TfoX/Sxy family transcriptional regulator of competence genes